jgi:hypothetical protein
MRLNQFLKVEKPSTKALVEFEKRVHHITDLVHRDDLELPEVEENEAINLIAAKMKDETAPTLIERGVTALLALYEQKTEAFVEAEEDFEEEIEEQTDELNIFTKVRLSELTQEIVEEDELEEFASPLLQKNMCNKQVEYVTRLLGSSDKKAANIAHEIIKDMLLGTSYPPDIVESPDVPHLVELIEELADSFAKMQGEEDEDEDDEDEYDFSDFEDDDEDDEDDDEDEDDEDEDEYNFDDEDDEDE